MAGGTVSGQRVFHLTMNEDNARAMLLVRAIEREDITAVLLTPEDRHQADAAGRRAGGTPDQFLAARAAFAATRLTTRNPAVERALGLARWPQWLNWVVPFFALVLGVAANELGNAGRLDLLAFPLLGTFAWNLAVYLWIIGHGMLRRPAKRAGAPGWVGRIVGIGRARFDQASPMNRALGRFAGDWAKTSAPLLSARTARTLHLGAALFALGLVGGIYLRALAVEYRAGWESTFLSPQAVHALLSALLGPASAVTGVIIPDAAGIAALRWTGPFTGGANAAPWIHLYTASAAGFIIVPRLLLATWAAIRARRIAARFPVPGTEDFYTRRLLRVAHGGSGSIRVTPYAFRPDHAQKSALEAGLRAAMGDRARVHYDDPVDYGAEDEWLNRVVLRPDDDHHLILFSLSATPEEENHGRFAAGLQAALDSARVGTAPGIVLDESGWRRHFSGQSTMESRLDTRRTAWKAALAASGVPVVSLDLANPIDGDAARLEGALIANADMVGA